MKKLLELLIHRFTIASFLIIAQLMLASVFLVSFNRYFSTYAFLSTIIGLGFAIMIINSNANQASKISWLVVLMILPLVGGILYVLIGQTHLSKAHQKRIARSARIFKDYDKEDMLEKEALEQAHPHWIGVSDYIRHQAKAPIHRLDHAEYYPDGESFWESLLQQLSKAESFIFMHYFIIKEGVMWDAILTILKEKAKQGVTVRVMYDDVGSVFSLPGNYHKTLRSYGIECHVFNPITPIATIQHNHRDHRKITIIDGQVGFVGGINLGDEYININSKFGHWKDTACLITGDGVNSLTKIFLSTWQYVSNTHDENVDRYFKNHPVQEHQGFVQAFSDSPLDDEAVGENIFLSTILQAQRYVHIFTPYLIISQEMVTACAIAAKSGIDIKIFMPGIPDKRSVFLVSRSHYRPLLQAGVKIYEYGSGFLHAKSMVCDDEIALIGTINLDYRSLYLHYENAALFIGHPIIQDMKKDVEYVLRRSKQINMDVIKQTPIVIRLVQNALKILAPLL